MSRHKCGTRRWQSWAGERCREALMSTRVGLLDYVMLRATDVQALVEAYRSVLGAIPIEESYPAWARIRLANIDVGIHLDTVDTGTVPDRSAELVFRVHDIAAFRAGIEGSQFVARDYDAIPGGVRLGFCDPAGNPLSVIQWGARIEDVEAASTPGRTAER